MFPDNVIYYFVDGMQFPGQTRQSLQRYGDFTGLLAISPRHLQLSSAGPVCHPTFYTKKKSHFISYIICTKRSPLSKYFLIIFCSICFNKQSLICTVQNKVGSKTNIVNVIKSTDWIECL